MYKKGKKSRKQGKQDRYTPLKIRGKRIILHWDPFAPIFFNEIYLWLSLSLASVPSSK